MVKLLPLEILIPTDQAPLIVVLLPIIADPYAFALFDVPPNTAEYCPSAVF